MSKRLALTAATALAKDLFGGPKKNFRLPRPVSFEFFNSLYLHSSDAFSGVSVVRLDSIYWITNTGRTSNLNDENGQPVYSGSAPKSAAMPIGAQDREVTRYIVVVSRELRSRPASYPERLEKLDCLEISLQDDGMRQSFFMFLRSQGLLSFDERRREEARRELISPDDQKYEETPFDQIEKYYEEFEVYAIAKNAALDDDQRPVFWASYIVAAFGGVGAISYLKDDALEQIMALYDEAHWHFTIDNARTAVASTHFKHCFIEFYRCLEWLYSLPRAISVKLELGLTEPATKLARTFSKELGWRRTEKDSLTLLLRDAEIHLYPSLQLAECLLTTPEPQPIPNAGEPTGAGTEFDKKYIKWKSELRNAVASRLYQIRNQFVHQLEQDNVEEISKESEPQLIHLLCWLCVKLYREYSAEF